MPWNEPLTARSRSASGRMMFGLLPPSSSVTRFSGSPALGGDLAADHGRAGERDLRDAGVVHQGGAGLAVAGEHVQRALRQPGLERELAEAQRGQRRLLGRLQDDRAAGRERRRDLPGRHQQREVPRDDLAADADGLAQRVAEDVAGGDRDRLALDLRRPARVVAQVVDGRGDVALRHRPAACRCRATRARPARRRWP